MCSLVSVILLLGSYRSFAQQIAGEFVLTGNHEMVAAFKFTPDNNFEFYFAYGAVDRMAKGSYTINQGKLLLKGEKIPARDFDIRQHSVQGTGTTIQVSDENPALIRGIVCLFIKGKEQEQVYTDEAGTAHSTIINCDTIFVLHTLYPDVLTTVKAGGDSKDNYFKLTLNPSLASVSFTDFALTIEGDRLIGSLPYLFESDRSVFVKR